MWTLDGDVVVYLMGGQEKSQRGNGYFIPARPCFQILYVFLTSMKSDVVAPKTAASARESSRIFEAMS
jgi:hypothetical protein